MPHPPFAFRVAPPESAEDDQVGATGNVTGIVRASLAGGGSRNDSDTLTSFIRRAVKLADEISAAIIELRTRQNPPSLRRFEASVLRTSWDKYELADYLLDPGAPDISLVEVRRYLIELAQNQVPRFAGEGSA